MKNKTLIKISFLIMLIFTALLIFSSCTVSDFITIQEKPQSIIGASINENGELIIKYDNGDTENLGVVVGTDGKDGVNGTNGIDGTDGKDGKDGVNGADGKDGAIIVQDGAEGTSLTQVVANVLQSTVIIQCEYTYNDETAYSSGSGVVYSCNKTTGDALIITNYHVVYNEKSSTDNKICEKLSVFLYGSVTRAQEIEAEFVGGSMQYDLAVLKVSNSDIIKSSEMSAVNVKNSIEVRAGDSVFAVGNPKADGFSVTSGIVSVDSENIEIKLSDELAETTMRVMRIDAAVNSGNSGGGLFDQNGKLIGIVNAKSIETNVENIGYAIPSSTVVAVVENIIDNCLGTECETVQRPLLGIIVQVQNPYSKYNSETGYVDLYEDSVVVEITDFSSIAFGKLQIGDIIKAIEINGENRVEITRQYQLLDTLLNARVGDVVTITVERAGSLIDVDFIITPDCITAS